MAEMVTKAGESALNPRGASGAGRQAAYLVGAVVVFLVGTGVAYVQAVRPEHRRPARAGTWAWWTRPVLAHPEAGLQRVSGTLNAITGVPGTGHVWAVGNRGLVLHSEDGGWTWEQQNPPAGRSGGGQGPGVGWLPWRVGTVHAAMQEKQGPTQSPVAPYAQQTPPNSSSGAPRGQQANLYDRPAVPRASRGTTTGRSVRPRPEPPTTPEAAPSSPVSADGEIGTVEDDLIAVHFATPVRGWAAGRYGTMLVTGNGGRTWGFEPALSGSGTRLQRYRSFAFTGQPRTWAFGVRDSRGEIEVVSHFGNPSTTEVYPSPRIGFQNALAVFPCGSQPVIAGRAGMVWDGFSVQPLPSPEKPDLNGIWCSNDSRVWAVGTRGAVWAGTRPGKPLTWQPQQSGTTSTLRAVWFEPDAVRGWVAGDDGVVLRTEDGGQTWTARTRLPAQAGAPLGAPQRWPAPLYYALVLPAAGLLLRRGLRAPPPLPPAVGVQDVLTSDKPLEIGSPDVMEFGRMAKGLSRFLRNEKTLPPLTIAVTGEWGTGKSSLMNLLKGDLERYGFRPVWFNAWHHQKEEHLLAALLENVQAQAVPRWWWPENWLFRLRLLRIRGARHWVPIALAVTLGATLVTHVRTHPNDWSALEQAAEQVKNLRLADALKSVSLDAGVLALLGTLLSGAVGLWKGLTAFGVNPASLMASVSGGARIRDLQAQTSFRHRFAAEFKDVAGALGEARPIVLFIDDLDRCQPQNVMEVLEAVNFLISSGPCFVVMGMARDRVERCVGLHFKDVAAEMADRPAEGDGAARGQRAEFARQYLDKLVNIEIPLPSPTDEQARSILAPAQAEPGEQRRDAWHRVQAKAAPAWQAAAPWVVLAMAIGLGVWLGRGVPGPAAGTTGGKGTPAATAAAPPGSGSTAQNSSGGRGQVPTDYSDASTGARPELSPAAGFGRPWSGPIALAVAGMIGLAVWALRRLPDLVVKDSPAFEAALRIWCPVVTIRQNTPRSLKRFLNRVRYLAMLQDPESREAVGWRERVRRRWRGAEEAKVPGGADCGLAEPTLVALTAVHYACPEWLSGMDRLPGRPEEFPSVAHTADAARRVVMDAAREHQKRFAWPPTADERQRFLALLPGVKVNGAEGATAGR